MCNEMTKDSKWYCMRQVEERLLQHCQYSERHVVKRLEPYHVQQFRYKNLKLTFVTKRSG